MHDELAFAVIVVAGTLANGGAPGMAAAQDNGPRNVVVTRVFDAPVDAMWRAWTEPEEVQRWWGPTGFTSPVAKMDVREGGKSLVCMRAPAEYGGQDIYTTWTYRRLQSGRLIEFVLNFADEHGTKLEPSQLGLEAGIPSDVHHVITFRPLGANRTEMTVTEYGYTSDLAHDRSKAGLEQSLDKMAAIFRRF